MIHLWPTLSGYEVRHQEPGHPATTLGHLRFDKAARLWIARTVDGQQLPGTETRKAAARALAQFVGAEAN